MQVFHYTLSTSYYSHSVFYQLKKVQIVTLLSRQNNNLLPNEENINLCSQTSDSDSSSDSDSLASIVETLQIDTGTDNFCITVKLTVFCQQIARNCYFNSILVDYY